MKSTRLFILTSLAMIAFASNSLLCRLALKHTTIDAATFTFIRILSGAVALWLILEIRTRLRTERTASLLFEGSSGSPRVARHSSLKSGNWPSALALFVYAAAFSFAYVDLSVGTGALLLFGAVQATMILWGFRKGERLDAIQVVGFVAAMIGLVVLVFPGLSAPPLIGSILMLGAGVAWGVYSLRGKGAKSGQRYGGKFCACCSVFSGCLDNVPSVDPCRFCWSQLRHNLRGNCVRSWLRDLVQRPVGPKSSQRGHRSTQRSRSRCYRGNSLARRTDHFALRFRFGCSARRNRTRYMGTDSRQTHMI